MSTPQQWHFTDAAGQQTGPVSPEQLQQLALNGQINANTQVWTEGLEGWVSAAQVEGLIPAAAPQAQAPVQAQPQAQAVAPTNPYTAQAAQAQPAAANNPYAAAAVQPVAPVGGEYPIPLIDKANFKLYLTCIIAGIACNILGLLLMPDKADDAQPGIVMAPFLIGFLLCLVPGVLNLVFLYRAWAILQPGGATITPGKAVGFLFIPIFGAIWAFIVFLKLPKEWNDIVSKYTNTQEAPRLSVGIAVCMLLIPFIGAILWARQVSRGINFMTAARVMPSQLLQADSSGPSFY